MMTLWCPASSVLLLVSLITSFSSLNALQQVALLTGATGRTGQTVTKTLLEQGFQVRVFCRDEQRAKDTLGNNNNNIEFYEGDLANKDDIEAAFDSKVTHVVFMAGGDGADYRCVNYKGVAEFAQNAAKCGVNHFVVVSTAWATRPYSIASLLFNSLYLDTVPMASHFLGEQALRKASADTDGRLNYVILRAGGLNSDERYAEKYPEAAGMGLTYQQGDSFDFFGFAGRPGMSRSQLANAVINAVNVEGQYTVEVTGSGDVNDSSIYQQLTQDKAVILADVESQEDEIMSIHTQAVQELKNTAIVASVSGIAFIALCGWLKGLFLLLSTDVIILLIWSMFFANKQTDYVVS